MFLAISRRLQSAHTRAHMRVYYKRAHVTTAIRFSFPSLAFQHCNFRENSTLRRSIPLSYVGQSRSLFHTKRLAEKKKYMGLVDETDFYC